MNEEQLKNFIETDKEEVKVVFTKQDAYNKLYDMCEAVHSSCGMECMIYERCVEDGEFDINKSNSCPYFKNGELMFERLKSKVRIEILGKNIYINYFDAKQLLESLKINKK